MPINHSLKLAFIHIPKTGGVSIYNALHMVEPGHQPASHYAKNYPEYVRFAVIRSNNERLESVKRYIRNPPIGSGNDLNTLIKDFWHWVDMPCHYYLRFERMEYDLNEMLKDLHIEPVELPHLNKTQ